MTVFGHTLSDWDFYVAGAIVVVGFIAHANIEKLRGEISGLQYELLRQRERIEKIERRN